VPPTAKEAEGSRFMHSIYEEVLGESYKKLHPQLQRRYAIIENRPFIAEGKMEYITGGSFLVRILLRIGAPLRLFFAERGRNTPFRICNFCENRDGYRIVRWERTFLFPHVKRYFDAYMFLQDNEVVDYFGKPPLLVSTLFFRVNELGAMCITTKKQWIRIGKWNIQLAKKLYGHAEIEETFDESLQCFIIIVRVSNPILGELFSYKGTFREIESDYK
jgi:hypothetical protein